MHRGSLGYPWSADMRPHASPLIPCHMVASQGMLLRRLQRDAEEKAAAATGSDGGDGQAAEAGMTQEDLVKWYIIEQINRWARGSSAAVDGGPLQWRIENLAMVQPAKCLSAQG